MTKQELVMYWETANQLQKNSYAPYSKFRVAAIVTMNDGTKIHGVNIENAAYPAAICAERVALAQVITLGLKPETIKNLFLMTDSKVIGSPCGLCRQVMVELMPNNAVVYISSSNQRDVNKIKVVQVDALLPFAFLPKSLIKKAGE